jgi:hypothetical protein
MPLKLFSFALLWRALFGCQENLEREMKLGILAKFKVM